MFLVMINNRRFRRQTETRFTQSRAYGLGPEPANAGRFKRLPLGNT